jgi:hypothetical protein
VGFVLNREQGGHVFVAVFISESNGVVHSTGHAFSEHLFGLGIASSFVEGTPEDTLD